MSPRCLLYLYGGICAKIVQLENSWSGEPQWHAVNENKTEFMLTTFDNSLMLFLLNNTFN